MKFVWMGEGRSGQPESIARSRKAPSSPAGRLEPAPSPPDYTRRGLGICGPVTLVQKVWLSAVRRPILPSKGGAVGLGSTSAPSARMTPSARRRGRQLAGMFCASCPCTCKGCAGELLRGVRGATPGSYGGPRGGVGRRCRRRGRHRGPGGGLVLMGTCASILRQK